MTDFPGSPIAHPGVTSSALAAAGIVGTLRNKSKRILVIGDSHVDGTSHTATVTGSEKIGARFRVGPRDWLWNGSAFVGGTSGLPFLANASLGSESGSLDPNASHAANVVSTAVHLPGALRDAFASLAELYLAVYGVGGASTFTWAGEQGQAFATAAANANDGDTITIAGQTYTFRTSPTVAFEVLIGASGNATILNLGNAVNAESTGWGAGTTRHTSVFVPNPASSSLCHVYALASGTSGNAFTITSPTASRIAAYNGGVAATSVTFSGGSATSALWSNMLTSLAVGSGFGTPDLLIVILGTNDASRVGYRGRGYQTEMAKIVANARAQWPNVQILIWKPLPSNAGATWDTAMTTIVAAVDTLVAANPSYLYSVNFNGIAKGSGDTAVLDGGGIHGTDLFYATYFPQVLAQKAGAILGLT